MKYNNSYPFVGIVILNWNDIIETLNCLESVYELDYPNFSVLLIDNGSKDYPEEIIKNKYPNIQYIQNNNNFGYTGGHNQGIKHFLSIGVDYIWLLNNDAIVQPSTLSFLLDMMEKNPELGMVSPIIIDNIYPDGTYYGSYIDPISLKLEDSKSHEEFLRLFTENWRNVCLWGTALFIRSRSFQQLGFLDERFFAYYEDTDFSLRMSKEGWKISICPSAYVEHNNQKSDPPKHYFYYMTRNEYLLIKKHSMPKNIEKNKLRWFSRYLRLAADSLFYGENHKSEAILDGIWHAIINKFGPYEYQRSMPLLIKKLLLWHPYLIARLLPSK